MKEVKGIGERLFGLDQLLANARKIVQEQGDLAQSFQQVIITTLYLALLVDRGKQHLIQGKISGF